MLRAYINHPRGNLVSASRRRRVSVAVIPVVAGLALGACDPAADPPAPASSSATVTAGDGAAVARWYAGGGDTLTTQLGQDLARIGADSGRGDLAAMAAGCESLLTDVGAAENYPPIPDVEAQGHWATALKHLRTGGTDCARGARSGDMAVLAASGRDIRLAAAEMRMATTRVNALLAANA